MTSTAPNPFQKATRAQLKARVAFEGPTGAGKTWTALEWATVLADSAAGRIAFVDTERGSAALYSDHFDFDVLAFEPPYEPGRLVDLLKAAEGHGYAVVVIDSLSHFWEGEGGTLDMVDAAAERAKGNSFAGWKVGTPALRHLVDTMLGLDAHLIATMRSKMEYVLETDQRGKQVPKKVGMAPVMRAGVEYEFTLVGDLDLEHRLVITKSRCDRLADEMVQPGRAGEAAKTFAAWLDEGIALLPVAVADELAARLNDAGPDARKAWRSQFGVAPRQLPADRQAEAVAFVEEIAAGSASPGGGEEGDASSDQLVGQGILAESEEADDVNEPPSVESSSPAQPEPAEDDEPPKTRFHRLVAELTDPDNPVVGCDAKELRHLAIHRATNGATTNSQQADREALVTAGDVLAEIADGRMLVASRAGGGFELRRAS